MGTSNWQNISFCVDEIRRIKPKSVLDVGIGFGRWGILIREFCDVWEGRTHPHQWKVHIEGIEAFAGNIQEYHKSFYNIVHLDDARNIIPAMTSRFDLIVFGDVLEHFEKTEAKQLLESSRKISEHVMINIPLGPNWPQDEAYGNPFEKHLSTWDAEDFPECRAKIFSDYINRPFGTFIY